MAINHNIEWEVKTSGSSKSGSAFNNYNANSGLNYSYGNDYQVLNIQNIAINHADNFKPGIPSWTTSFGGLFPGGTYYIGIRYVALGAENEIVATSELVEYADFIPNNRILTINSPSNPGYPFEHYQVFIRTLSGSNTFAQLQNYGGGEVATSIGVNLVLNSFSTAFTSIPVANLPDTGNVFQLSSIDRNFISNDIGNFIHVENNNIGFRARGADQVDNVNFVEICKTNDYKYAAWFDLSEVQTVKQISAVLWAQGAPSGDLFLELRSNNFGVPSNVVLDSGGINANTLGSTPQWVDVAINSVLSPGRYWIVINFDSAPDLSNYVKLGRKTSTGFQNLNNQHLFEYNTGTFTWSNISDGMAVAIGVLWNSTEIWGEGDYSPYVLNQGNMRFEILNISSGEALICSNNYVSEIGNSLGIIHLGGASDNLLQINEHATELQIDSIVHLQAGTYTIYSPLVLSYLSIIGYQLNHYDLGSKPMFIVDNGVDPSQFNYSTGVGAIDVTGSKIQILNIELDGNDFAEKLLTATNSNLFISNCWFHNSAHSGLVFGPGTNQAIWVETTMISDFLTESSISAGIYADDSNHLMLNNCYITNIAGCGIYANGLSLKAEFCIFHDIYGTFTNNGHSIIADNCTDVSLNFLTVNQSSKSGVDFRQSGNVIVYNSLFTNGADHGILIDMDKPTDFKLNRIYNNAFYNNAGNQVEVNPPFLAAISSISLLSNPYMHIGLDYVDFTPNTVNGSGIHLVAKAYPKTFIGTESIQKLDIGAVQTFGNQQGPRRNPTVSLF